MAKLKSDRFTNLLKSSRLFFATIIALCFVLPIAGYVVEKHAVIAPVHILSGCCGWAWEPNNALPNNIPSDVTDFVLPDRYFVRHAFSTGQIPLWNPSYFGGEVFLANLQSTVLHPVNLLDLVTNELNVQTISVLLSLFLLCLSTVLMLLHLGRSRAASALGGITLAGSTFAMFWSTFGMMSWIMAAAPLSIYFFLRWRQGGGGHWLGWLALCLGTQLYFGHIQFEFMTFTILALFAIYHLIFGSKKRAVRSDWLLAAAAVAAGGLIGAAQLLPFLQQAQIGHRAGVVLSPNPAGSATVFHDLSNFIKPYLFGPFGKTGQYFFDYGPFRFSIGFLGFLLVVAAGLKIVRQAKNSKDEIFFFGLLIFGMLWMWGSLPQQIMDHLFSTFKSLNPGYFMAIPIFAAAVLAAYGFDYLFGYFGNLELKNRRRLKKRLTAVVLAGLVLAPLYAEMVLAQGILYLKDINYGHVKLIGAVYILSTVALLAFCLCLLPLLRSGRAKSWVRITPFLFVLANALLIFRLTAPVDAKSLYRVGNPYYDYVLKDNPGVNPADIRIVTPYSPQTNLYYGLSTLNGYDSLYGKTTETMIHAINYPQATFELSAGPHGSHNAIYVGNVIKTDLLENLGVSYIVASPSAQIPGYTMVDQAPAANYALYKADRPAPQIYFADSSVKLSEQKQLQAIKDNSLAYHQVALESGVQQSPSDGDRVSYDLDVNKINISESASAPRLLFVGQTDRPEWKAYIDGKRTDIQRADYNFMAIKVPAGNHKVSLVYDPASFKVGATVTIITLAATFGYIIYAYKKP